MPESEGRSPMNRFANSVISVLESPVTWFRESIVVPNQKQYPWYHQEFRRVPTIDQCYTDDVACQFEADQQFRRDKMVENEILNILRQRFEDCMLYEAPDHAVKCKDILANYENAAENWFVKYGDLGAYGKATACYMKQKHRLIWERRHGKVGSGMKSSEE